MLYSHIAVPKGYVAQLEQRLERVEQEKLELIKVYGTNAFSQRLCSYHIPLHVLISVTVCSSYFSHQHRGE